MFFILSLFHIFLNVSYAQNSMTQKVQLRFSYKIFAWEKYMQKRSIMNFKPFEELLDQKGLCLKYPTVHSIKYFPIDEWNNLKQLSYPYQAPPASIEILRFL